MAIPATAVGTQLAPFSTVIERGRLRFFAEAIGESDRLYTDVDTARAAGYPDLPVPPTFLFGLKLDAPNPFDWMTDLGIDLRFVLHGSQRFEYHELAFAGDAVTYRPRITDLYDKRDGALEFLTVEYAVSRGEQTIAELIDTIVVRHP